MFILASVIAYDSRLVLAEASTDPAGDLFDRQGRQVVDEAYLDIVEAQVVQSEGEYRVRIKVEGPLPASLTDPSIFVEWGLLIDMDRDPWTSPWGTLPLMDNGIGVDFLIRLMLGPHREGFRAEAEDLAKKATHRIEFRIDGVTLELIYRPLAEELLPKAFDYVFQVRKFEDYGRSGAEIACDKTPNQGYFAFSDDKTSLVMPRRYSKLLEYAMCKYVDTTVIPPQIIGKGTRLFLHTDEEAILRVRLQYLETGAERFVAIWYEPSGKTYRVTVGGRIKIRAGLRYTVLDGIRIRGTTAAESRGYWRVEVFLDGELLFTENFTIGPFYTVKVSVHNLPVEYSVPLTVDGQFWGPIRQGEERPLGFAPETTNSIRVKDGIFGKKGTRYYASNSSRTVSSESSIIFKYDLQYRLEAMTDPPMAAPIMGDGWHTSGSTATVGDSPRIIDLSPVTRLVLISWIMDGVFVSERPSAIRMDSAHQVVARYRIQHYLTVSSQYGDPRGEGWHDEGSMAEFSVATPAGFLIQQVLVNWTGDVSTTSPRDKTRMDRPKTVTAQWRADYTQLNVAIVIAVGVIAGLVVMNVRRRRRELVASAILTVPLTPAAPGPGLVAAIIYTLIRATSTEAVTAAIQILVPIVLAIVGYYFGKRTAESTWPGLREWDRQEKGRRLRYSD